MRQELNFLKFINYPLIVFLLSFILFSNFSYSVSSERPEPKLYLLKKLEKLDKNLPKDYPGRDVIQLRKAHILSLLAEENYIKFKKQTCRDCFKQSQLQSEKALSLYVSLDSLVLVQEDLHNEILFQKARLHRILGNRSSALALLQKITQKDRLKKDWMIRAWYGIGEIEFELYNYESSLKAFNQVLKQLEAFYESFQSAELDKRVAEIDRNELARWEFKSFYHKIWSLYNLSQYDSAVKNLMVLLQSDLYKNNSSSFWLDEDNQVLRTKLEKEAINLLSYAKVSSKDLKVFHDFSKQNPEDNSPHKKNKRLYDLAVLLGKMARFQESNKVWQFYLSGDPKETRSKSTKKEPTKTEPRKTEPTKIEPRKTEPTKIEPTKTEQLQAYFFVLSNTIQTQGYQIQEMGLLIEKIFHLQQELIQAKAKQKASYPDQDFNELINEKIKKVFYELRKIDLNTGQKRYLLSLYEKYNKQNPEDKDVLLLAAFLTESLKEHKLAVSYFQKVILESDRINQIKSKDKKTRREWKEQLCFKQMELAELSQDKNTRLKAYAFYIQEGQDQGLKHKALYQTAYLYHQEQEFVKSQPLFLSLATNNFDNLGAFDNKKEASQKLRLKSAHLYLSALADIQDQEEELIRASSLFKKEFPKEKADFVKIHNLAVLNFVERLVKETSLPNTPIVSVKDREESDIHEVWSVLERFDVSSQDTKPLEAYHLNRLILAKSLLKLVEFEQSLQFLSSHKSLFQANRDLVLKEKLWLAELRFDFDEVLKLLKQIQTENQNIEEAFKQIQVVELSNQNPAPYYENFLKSFSNNKDIKMDSKTNEYLKSVLTSFLELSNTQQFDPSLKFKPLLINYRYVFQESPDDLLYWILKIDGGEVDMAFLKVFIENNRQSSLSFLSSFLKRKQSLESFEKILDFKKRDPQKISTRQMARVIKNYSDYIAKIEKQALSLLESTDWATQVFIVGSWKRELQQFYDFVLELPTPKGLTELEKADYKKLLVKQMQLYVDKIKELEARQEQLVSQPFLLAYQKALETSVFHPYVKWEMQKMVEFLNDKDQKAVQLLLEKIENQKIGSQKNKLTPLERDEINSEIQKKHKALRLNPFNADLLKALLTLEEKRNNKPRVRYLFDRIKQLEETERKSLLFFRSTRRQGIMRPFSYVDFFPFVDSSVCSSKSDVIVSQGCHYLVCSSKRKVIISKGMGVNSKGVRVL